MSFAIQAKQGLCSINIKKDCCRRALLYGILLFAVDFNETRIRLITESEATATLTLKLLEDMFHITGNRYITEKKQTDEDGEVIKSHKITVSVKNDIKKILDKLAYYDGSTERIYTEFFKCENCRASFLRGCFLSSGILNNPELSYHLEIHASTEELADGLVGILEQADISAKVSSRRGKNFVYIKSSEQIENFLAYIGASEALFEMMNKRIIKEAMNDANRRTNCDTANLNKTVSAAKAQTDAIKGLIASGKIELLPPELRQTALLRLENPELSIKDFGMLFPTPISKSGVNHRLKKIMDFAENN